MNQKLTFKFLQSIRNTYNGIWTILNIKSVKKKNKIWSSNLSPSKLYDMTRSTSKHPTEIPYSECIILCATNQIMLTSSILNICHIIIKWCCQCSTRNVIFWHSDPTLTCIKPIVSRVYRVLSCINYVHSCENLINRSKYPFSFILTFFRPLIIIVLRV